MVQCCDITPASLKTRIVIERRVRTADGQGGQTEAWVADPAGGVYAKVQNMSGTKRYEADRTESTNLVNFFVRFKGNAEGAPYWEAASTRVVCRGRYYNVLAVVDLELKKRWIRIFTQEGDIA